MNTNSVHNKLQEFAKPAIELSLADITKLIENTKFQYMRVWSDKANDAGAMRRVMQTQDPTGGEPSYDYKRRGYWVMWSQDDRGWRTIVLKKVKKIKIGNQVYKNRDY